MAHLLTSETYQSDDVSIEEIILEIDNDEIVLRRPLEDFDASTSVVIQNLFGEMEHDPDLPLERTTHNERGTIYTGETSDRTLLFLRFRASGFAKARVLITRIRHGFSRAFKGAPCKLCKLAVKTIVSTILVQLGVPTVPTGEFDLKAFVSKISNAAGDILNGAYGRVAEALSGLLPANWWNVVLNVLHGANWFLDATDAFFEKICRLIGMCIPSSSTIPQNLFVPNPQN